MINVAVCQYQTDPLANWEAYAAKQEAFLKEAKKAGANLLVLPEYTGVEMGCSHFATELELFTALQPLIPRYKDFFSKLAVNSGLYILAGTILEQVGMDKFLNRAYFFSPEGKWGFQDKLMLTEYEKSTGLIVGGNTQNIFACPLGNIGIAVCYDIEFPEVVRALTLSGAQLLLVPSYTTTLAGYNRVAICSRARAIENQCYVAVSFMVNTVDISVEPERTHGCAGIYSPADNGFPSDGILAQGSMDQVGIASANLLFDKLDAVRQEGQVLNFADCKDLTPDREVSIYSF